MKCISFLLLTFFSTAALAQPVKPDLRKRPTLVGHLSSFDFQTPSDIIRTSLRDTRWRSLGENYSGLGLSYWMGITSKIDIAASVNGSKVFYAFRDGIGGGSRKLLLEADVAANLKLFADDHLVTPFLTAGLGGYHYGGRAGLFAPLGAGVQVNLKDKLFLMTSFQYRTPVTAEAQHHFLYNFSVGVPLTRKRSRAAAPQPEAPALAGTAVTTDTDGDGIPDRNDQCPTVPGTAAYRGCPPPPDSDQDGIVDSLDECPDVPGLISYRGCPLPDSDNDSIPDFIDKCPNDSGLQRYDGCPIPDTDGDGVNDEIDKCPTVKGSAQNNGCPLPVPVKPGATATGKKGPARVLTTYEVFFYSGLTIMPQAATATLNGVVSLLTKNPELQVEIDGFADNLEFGTDDKAKSTERALAIYRYLVAKGIQKKRLAVFSQGAAKPKASNETVVGRSQNRRVDIRIINR